MSACVTFATDLIRITSYNVCYTKLLRQIYAGKVDLKLGAMTITPAFLYQKYEKQSTITATSYYGTAKAAALTFAMKQGPLRNNFV